MSAPRMPGHTCPMIDKLKCRIEDAYDLADKPASDDVNSLKGILREIRHELHGEADGLRLQMEAAIASRSPEQVAHMEAERGLTTS